MREALKCREAGEQKVLLFNLSGHGLIDMAAYDRYLAGDLQDFIPSDEELHRTIGQADALQ